MRSSVRAAVAVLATLASLVALTTSAQADKHPRMPSQAQVDAAKQAAARKAGDVASLQAELAVATARLHSAAEQAEVAAEAYNGAMWRLQKAQEATAKAKADAAAALAEVEAQRAGVAQLVTQSYLDGSSLNGVKAFLGDEGPEGIMNRWGVVNSATDSMQATYDEYTALAALAHVATEKAEKAEKAQAAMADQAQSLRDAAAAAANSAQSQAAVIAGQRRTLIEELAEAQKISVALATKRQHGLEQVAQQQASAAAAAQAKDKAEKAKYDVEDQTDQVDQTNQELENLPEEGGWGLPGLPIPAGTSEGAARAIRFARAQLGEPYVWAAAGPDAWDCSGLTMMAWRAGGVSLPHYSAAQYQQSKHITVGQLRAGDLVFWGTSPNTIHHVALYIGSGQILHAPRTGQPVQINSMYYWVPPDYFGRP